MKKLIFKSAICAILAISMVLCLVSCGTKMDKYEDRLEELEDEGEIYGYSDAIVSTKSSYEDYIEEAYDIDVEIEEMFSVGSGIFSGRNAYVIEFGSTSQAKKFVKAYEEEYQIGFEGKLDRVTDFIDGRFDGDLDELFEFDIACERDGKVVIFGATELVEAIVK